jgi:hypothetical protein
MAALDLELADIELDLLISKKHSDRWKKIAEPAMLPLARYKGAAQARPG